MKTISACLLALLGTASAGHAGGIHNTSSAYRDGDVVGSEPGPFRMQLGQTLYVDDRPCPAGQIKQVTAPLRQGGPRTRQRVVH